MKVEYSIRTASPADFQELLNIAAACAEAPRWSGDIWRNVLASDREVARAVFVAQADENNVGFIVVSCAAATIAEIESVAVLPAFRRVGIGRALCLEAMRWARTLGAPEIELEVRASSVGAIALYGVLGFVEQGRRCGYYREPADDAVLMVAGL